ncbi:zinc transport system substrate-binding protein [Thalassovita litoralis]|jgi:zinc transport system substrate-binding protein|uniref:High-affinity zinc uptake system protein ZnuA n=1 Tax=Thalassovita litoralis TaxID=1010611 RepID=A0A521D963_9RHOB|nr:zinc ABC transporter substrate-binding protein [Thalassovita litoralis]SMO68218.1 zinc transport system substrate-binding protein [Thalassovita litoralis]
MRLPLMTCGAALLAGSVLAETPHVVADITPVHSLVARVMQGVGEPTLLVEPGASPHGYALRPSQAAALNRADAVFWIGEALEPWLEGPLETLGGKARQIELMTVPGTTVLEYRLGAAFEKHDHGDDDDHGHDDAADDKHDHDDHDHDHDEHDHAEKDSHDHEGHDDHAKAETDQHGDHDGHDHTGMDSHGWLDPMNAHVWLGAIAQELGRIDPENATRYAANAAEGQAELDELVAELNVQLAAFRQVNFIVFHDAYQYFENRFDLSAVGSISLGDASEPGAARIAEIRNRVQELNVTCVFAEPQFNPGLIKAVSDGGVKVAEIDPLGTTLEVGPSLYPSLMRELANSISACQ